MENDVVRSKVTASNKRLPPSVSRADRTRRALVRGILREKHKEIGPRGYPDEIVLRAVNSAFGELGLPPVSLSTMRRARREEYGW